MYIHVYFSYNNIMVGIAPGDITSEISL